MGLFFIRIMNKRLDHLLNLVFSPLFHSGKLPKEVRS
ncbi:hypothetical protein HCH_03660 [Hahella chejuensis KCTC 2396]|uniref:Uncharacterized protein n=1 Tax=Hahella chejuensis (strain KCTC 2396) TaxID=349521 RepID=Q2SG24_HAHCH|nr:hypothetical protein HCH_03660 [Hahella chejuensis KCTC 2396]